MIAEIIPAAYDSEGRQVSQLFQRRKGVRSTFPMGRYVAQPLRVKCKSISDIQTFLKGCEYVSDKELSGKVDYWQPPEEFEIRKKGDCEDFALWTWRQMVEMGYDARFAAGRHGRYGTGHAWVEFFEDGRCYLVEPLRSRLGRSFPRLSTLRYSPRYSVSWDGRTLRYFTHKKPTSGVSGLLLLDLVGEYVLFWLSFWIVNFYMLPLMAWRILHRTIFNPKSWMWSKRRGL